MLRLEERDPEEIRFYLEGEKPDDDKVKARPLSRSGIAALHLSSLPFVFGFLSQSLLLQLSPGQQDSLP